MTDSRTLHALVDSWRGRRILVLGDIVADEQVIGRPLAIAREAPVMVLEEVSRQVVPGGATNLAANARALGAEVAVLGVVGDDAAGHALRASLEERGIDTRGVLTEPGRPTTTKTRIWGGGAQQQVQQLLLRLDRVERSTLGDVASRRFAAALLEALDGADALMLSDYENGLIHPGLIQASLHPALERGLVVTVDSHGDLRRFRGATLFTPNQPEAEATLGRRLTSRAALEEAGTALVADLGARAVLITRGQEGMSLFEREASPRHLPTASTVAAVDPTGAGDTVAAAFTLAACAGGALNDAALVASAAAAVVVARVGTAVATTDDLHEALEALPRSWAR